MNARRLLCSTLATTLGALVFASAPALAAPEAPETSAASSITATSVSVGGVLNPNGLGEVGVYYFAYAPRGAACNEYTASAELPTPGFEKEAITPVELANLEPSTLYTYCLTDRSLETEETTYGSAKTFTTLAAPPAVEGETTSGANSTAATLEGQVNPNNQTTSCVIEYGTTTGYGTSDPCEPASLEGYGDQRAALPVSGLEPGTTYHFRIVAENASKEKTEGVDYAFTTVPTPNTDPVSAIAAITATLNGHLTLNPVDTQYSFDYKIGTECTGESTTPSEDAGGGSGTLVSPSTVVSGLRPHTQYTVCFVTSNAFGSEQGPPVSFTTIPAQPTIATESVTEVRADSAKLNAEVDPGGAETSYRFEYGTTVAYGQTTGESWLSADNNVHSIIVPIQGLQPGTPYHYRLVATNSQSTAGGTLGPDETFTTQAVGGVYALPDGRAYEQVSPVEKDGAEVLGIGGGGVTLANGDATQASEDGLSVSYITTAPVGANPPGNTYATQVFSKRGSDGWSSQDIAIPHPNPVETSAAGNLGEEYLRFSPDLSRAVVMTHHSGPEPPLAPEIHQEVEGPAVGEHLASSSQEIYIRNNLTGVFQAAQTFEPLSTIAFEGASPDLSHIVFEDEQIGLDPEYPAAGGLYEWVAGHTQLVSVLPSKKPASGESVLGHVFELVEQTEVVLAPTMHAVSDDGTRVVWATEGKLYTRDMATGETTAVGSGEFLTASSDGLRIFYSSTEPATSREVFMFSVANGTQTDLGGGATPNPASGMPLFVANEAGTSVYEMSPAVLTNVANGENEKASPGASNTYLLRETPAGSGSWSPTFITAGAEEGSESRPVQAGQTQHVSPNGNYLAFMSQQNLTGYDNRDVNSGQPVEEVYLYDALTNKLVCASCNPTGARPVSEYATVEQLGPPPPMTPQRDWEGHWLSATIPGWTPNGFHVSTGYQPRSLTNFGRLFFDSADALVPRDVNGRDDVYEYEPQGAGSCVPSTFGLSGGVVRDLSGSGCVALISAGTGSTDSLFFDASANGTDVFFTTQDGLVPQDKDGTNDMYDARVCSQSEPCLVSPVGPPPCATTDSCRLAPAPQPGVYAAPASATFNGAANVTPVTPTVAVENRGISQASVRAAKLRRALRACERRSKRRRARCEARARKLYGTTKTSGRRVK
jgi:hypothetical protein